MTDRQIERLNKIINKFPKLKELAKSLNDKNIRWAIAAGSAYFVYKGGGGELNEVGVWISGSDKDNVESIVGVEWKEDSSERHSAIQIYIDGIDLFTNCKKYKNKTIILDYLWTASVSKNIRSTQISDINYFVVSPEDVAILKMANPRGLKEKRQVRRLLKNADMGYLENRKRECKFIELS
jgi:hypothetical protein